MTRMVNKVVRIGLAGGLIGAMITNTRSAFDKAIAQENQLGWNLCHVEAVGANNLIMLIIRVIILVLTLGLFTLGANYILIFEKDYEAAVSAAQAQSPTI